MKRMIQMTIFYHNRTICRQLMSDKCVTWKLSEFQNLIPSYCNETKLIQLILIYKFPETNIFTISSRWLFESIFFSIRASWCQQWRPWAWLGTFSPSECSDPPTLIWRWILWRFLRKLQLFFSSFLKSCDVTVIYWDSWELCKLIFC